MNSTADIQSLLTHTQTTWAMGLKNTNYWVEVITRYVGEDPDKLVSTADAVKVMMTTPEGFQSYLDGGPIPEKRRREMLHYLNAVFKDKQVKEINVKEKAVKRLETDDKAWPELLKSVSGHGKRFRVEDLAKKVGMSNSTGVRYFYDFRAGKRVPDQSIRGVLARKLIDAIAA